MYKLIYKEYGEEITVTSTTEEPLLVLLKQLFSRYQDEFGLVFYGKEEEENKPYKNNRGTGHIKEQQQRGLDSSGRLSK